jgi:hypothetical protein
MGVLLQVPVAVSHLSVVQGFVSSQPRSEVQHGVVTAVRTHLSSTQVSVVQGLSGSS